MWNIERMTGYKPMTTVYKDLSIAERFGEYAIKSTYKDLLRNLECNYKYITELVMALNWKIWEHYNTDTDESNRLAILYDYLWREAQNYVYDHFNEKELEYYYRTTD